jgi:hypothetical protein
VSIWASVTGDDPEIYDGDDGTDLEPGGWIDIAVSAYRDRIRIIIRDYATEARISLDPAGLAELHRRIVIARGQIAPQRGIR